MKREMKDHLKSLSVKELMIKLEELQTERNKLETTMRTKTGGSTSVRNYPSEVSPGRIFGNIKRVKKDIARVKTWLNVKMKADHNQNGKRRK